MNAEARRTAILGGGVGLFLAVALLLPCLRGTAVPGRGDLAPFFWPMKTYTASRWMAGELPLWNPLSGCGEPWLAQLQTGALYPGDLPFLLRWPYGPLAGIALHLALAASGMAAWLYSLGTSRGGALAGAAAFAGGGAFLSLFPVYNNACTAAWLPWVFLGARRAAEEGRVVSLALPAGLAFLAGEPALAAAGGLGAAAVALASRGEGERGTAVPTRRRAATKLSVGLLLGIALAAAALLPFAEYVVRTGRWAGVDRAEAMARPVGPGDLADLVLPPSNETTRAASPARGGYLLSLALGPGVLLLAAGGGAGFPGRGRLLLALSGLALVGLLLSLGEKGLLAPLLFKAGLLHGIRFPARWFVFPHILIAVLAGAGFDGWLYGSFSSRIARVSARSVLAVTGLLVAFCLVSGTLQAGRDGIRGAAAVLPAVVLLALLVRGRRSPGEPSGWRVAAVFLLALVPLPLIASDPLEAVAASEVRPDLRRQLGLAPREPEPRVLSILSDPTELSRWTLEKGERWTAETAGRQARGMAGYVNLYQRIPSADSASPSPNRRRIRVLGAALQGGSPEALFSLANVGHVISPFPVSMPGARLAAKVDGVFRYDFSSLSGRTFFPKRLRTASDDEVFRALKDPALDPGEVAYVPEGTAIPATPYRLQAAARIAQDLPERTEIVTSSSAATFLVLTRSFDEGWKGEVDGRPFRPLRADLAFTGLPVPAGDHRIVLRYQPLWFWIGAAVSVASLLLYVGLWLNSPPPRELAR